MVSKSRKNTGARTRRAPDTTKADPTIANELIAALPRCRSVVMQALWAGHVCDAEDRNDLQQQTFLIVIEKIRVEGLNDPTLTGLHAYLYGTARRLSIEYWRRRRWAALRFMRDKFEHEDEEELVRRLPDCTYLPENAVEREALPGRVREALNRLQSRDREALERTYLQDTDQSHREIGAAMQLPELRFNQVLWRARNRFTKVAKELQPCWS